MSGSSEQVLTSSTSCCDYAPSSRSRHTRHNSLKIIGQEQEDSSSSSNSEAAIYERLDKFLADLEKKLDIVEAYGVSKLEEIDSTLVALYETMGQIRQTCGKQADELLGSGFLRLERLICVVDEKCEESSEKSNFFVARILGALEYRLVNCGLLHVDTVVDAVKTLEGHAEHISTALATAKERLLCFHELPEGWRENGYIVQGYRFCSGPKECVSSIVQIHNETCNIWTHLLGLVFMVGLAFYHYPNSDAFSTHPIMDRAVFFLFLFAAIKCLACSTIWHTFCHIGHLATKKRMACFDYSGISILITCSILTTQYASFYCQPIARSIYMAITLIFGAFGSCLTWSPRFDEPRNRPVRIIFFVSFAFSSLAGLIHLAITRGLTTTLWFYTPVIKSLLCYCAGIVFYGLLIPERWYPGTIFDWIGMSHNLWHIAVFGGIYFQYKAVHEQFEGAQSFSCG